MTDSLITRRSSVTSENAVAYWIRDPSWPACDAEVGDNKIVALHSVWPAANLGDGGNFVSMQNQGAYTIDYGDGTIVNYDSNEQSYYEYDYNDLVLAGTDAPVTITSADNTVLRTAHGYLNGMQVRFFNLTGTTGLKERQIYYVAEVKTNSFKVSATLGGATLSFSGEGAANLLPYKVAVVTVTPQVGNDLTSISFYEKHNQANLVNGYSTGWLEIAIASDTITFLAVGNTGSAVRHSYLESVKLNELGAITSFSQTFANCALLQNIEIAPTITTITNVPNMFSACRSLKSLPMFDTSSVTTFNRMAVNCSNLTVIPFYDTSLSTNFASMFEGASFIINVPAFDLSNAATVLRMFGGCLALNNLPPFNLGAISSSGGFDFFVNGCASLSRFEATGMQYTFSVLNCKLSAAALNELYTNLPTVAGQTITVSGNYGIGGDDPTIATAKGWTVVGS